MMYRLLFRMLACIPFVLGLAGAKDNGGIALFFFIVATLAWTVGEWLDEDSKRAPQGKDE